MEIRVRLERDEDGVWVAGCPSLPGCISQGKSQREALENIKAAVKLHIRSLAEDGLPIFESKGVKETMVEVRV